MNRREFSVALGSVAVWTHAVLAQQVASRTVGVLGIGSLESLRKGFAPVHRRLAEVGYVEGRNLTIEYRSADGQDDRLAALVGDLVQRRVDAIAVFAGQSIAAAKAATTSIPIIFFTGFDPVASGFVASLNRPGGNLTGITVLNTQVLAKRLEMLRELVPTARSIGFLNSPTNVPGRDLVIKELASAADTLGVKLLPVEARRPDEFGAAFERIANEPSDALLLSSDALFFINREPLVALAARYKIPTIFPIREFAASGGLASYGTNYPEAYGQVGDYLGLVLNGEKPESLPVRQVTKLELVINLKTAKALGLTVPPSLLARADELIE